MAPWQGPRHRSWASNTALTVVVFVTILASVVVSDALGDVPEYLVALLGTASGALFAALASDKKKADADTRHTADTAQQTADRAESKADALGQVAAEAHPDAASKLTPPFKPDDLGDAVAGGDRR